MTTGEHPITMHEPLHAQCTRAPVGWRCTRGAGHEGPCAAVHWSEDREGLSADMRHTQLQIAADRAFKSFNEYTQQPDNARWEAHRRALEDLGKALSL